MFGQIATAFFRAGQPVQARAALAKVKKLTKVISPELRHNAAIADYYMGKKNEALDALRAVAPKVPLAYCNLGVAMEDRGAAAKAYELFAQCRDKGGRFPNLKSILEIKRQILGPQ